VKADFEKRRAMADKLLRLDPLGLRHKLPRSAFVWLHATGRRVAYRFTNTEQVGGAVGHHRRGVLRHVRHRRVDPRPARHRRTPPALIIV
jgi:hypothetical protein